MSIEDTPPEADIIDADPGLSGWEDPLASLKRALDQDELQVYCQPIRALGPAEDRFPMAEVLVRLREEEDALLPPGDFLPVFEHYRMLCELDSWVVRKTVEWIGEARSGSIRTYSVNVSSQSLDDPRLLACISETLALHGVSPSQLCMEIDESDTLQRGDAAQRFAAAIREIGCKVVIDGFARRSVSFAALKALQPDFVKVDGAVVRKIEASAVARLKLKAIVRVGTVIGIGVIAECVEEEAVVAQLNELSVGYAQGFGIAVPRPIHVGGFPPG